MTLPSGWRLARLDEVLSRVDRKLVIDDGVQYNCVGVRWYGNGAFIRERQLGADIARKQQWMIQVGDVVYNKLFAWKGAFAIADKEVDGCIVSDKFPTYRIDSSQLDPRYLGYYFATQRIAQQAQDLSKGAAAISKLTLNPPQFWDLTIPLPSLTEQHRIAVRIEELERRVEEARRLRQESISQADALVTSLHLKLSSSKRVKLNELLALDEIRVPVLQDSNYPQVGLKSFGKGLFPKTATPGTETSYNHFNKLYAGAVVLSQVKGWEGAIAVCPDHLIDWYVSPEYRTFRCIPDTANPEYLRVLFATPWFWTKLQDMTRGVGARRERIRPEQFMLMELPFPTIRDQAYAMGIFAKLDNIREPFSTTQKEMDALLPSILARAFAGEL